MAKPGYRTYSVSVAHVDRLTPSFVRVRFSSDELADIGWDGPDQRIKVVLPVPDAGHAGFPTGDDWYGQWRLLPERERNPIRTYTIRRADRQARELVVDFVAHGDTGPASRWIASADVGDSLLVIAPDGSSGGDAGGYEWNPGGATTLLLAGDETATPAVCSILESLPSDASGAVFLEVPSQADILQLRAPERVSVTWLPRNASVAGTAGYGELLTEAVRAWAAEWCERQGGVGPNGDSVNAISDDDDLWDVPSAPSSSGLYAWLAGEAGAITGLRRYLVRDLGIDRSRVAFMGYWKLGRAEN
jgi:NADPH-dependent ferric siderophore reductase